MIYYLPEEKNAPRPPPLAAPGSVIAPGIAIGIMIVHGYRQFRANTDKVSQSQETIFATEDISRSVRKAETGERGFVTSAGEVFPELYQLGREALAAAIERSDNSAVT